MSKTVFAIAAHPDDIEFLMAGTLLHLREAGCETHYMNVANGHCGSLELDKASTIATRREEAKAAAASMGAIWHEPLVDDLAVFYDRETTGRLCAIMREVRPDILLLQSPSDYMEDHQNTVRVAVTAAFCRGMPNFETQPEMQAVQHEMAVYHAAPHGNRDPLRRLVRSECYVDVAPLMCEKRRALACHASQKEWLDHSQGMDAYLDAMVAMNEETGRLSEHFQAAEGWRRRNPLGFSTDDYDPLDELLEPHIIYDREYATMLSGR